MNSTPPAKPPKPGQVKVVRAMYKYEAQYPDELSFEEGEVLYIVDGVSDPNWLKARCGTRVGLVPGNYVDENVEIIETPMHDAAKRGNVPFLNECIANGVSVNTLDKAGNTALYWSAHGGHTACMIPLLQSPNIDINVQNKLGDTALHAAVWKCRPEAVELLLESGADVDIRNCEGKTALELSRDPQITDLIMKHQDTLPASDYDAEYFGDEQNSD